MGESGFPCHRASKGRVQTTLGSRSRLSLNQQILGFSACHVLRSTHDLSETEVCLRRCLQGTRLISRCRDEWWSGSTLCPFGLHNQLAFRTADSSSFSTLRETSVASDTLPARLPSWGHRVGSTVCSAGWVGMGSFPRRCSPVTTVLDNRPERAGNVFSGVLGG